MEGSDQQVTTAILMTSYCPFASNTHLSYPNLPLYLPKAGFTDKPETDPADPLHCDFELCMRSSAAQRRGPLILQPTFLFAGQAYEARWGRMLRMLSVGDLLLESAPLLRLLCLLLLPTTLALGNRYSASFARRLSPDL